MHDHHNPHEHRHDSQPGPRHPRRGVRRELPIYLIAMNGRGADYQVSLSWSPADPWALTLSIPSGRHSHESWLFARELLWTGLSTPTGTGAVRIEPGNTDTVALDTNEVEIRLYDAHSERHAHLIFSRHDLWEFLQATKAAFPTARDTARRGMDAELTRLLARPTAAPGEDKP